MLTRLKHQRTVVRGFEIDAEAGTVYLDVTPSYRVGTCADCGTRVHARYDTRPREWRHTDLGEMRVVLRYGLRRLACPKCGSPKTERVPWAAHAAWHTYDFEDLVAYHAQQTSTTRAAELMRVSWPTVGEIVRRVVARKLPPDILDGVRRIGIDELSYRKHHEYVTVVVDHDRRRVVWSAPGKSGDTVRAFFAALGAERTKQLELVSIDMSSAYIAAVEECAPHARVAFDRFHVQRLAQDVLDEVRRALQRELGAQQLAHRARVALEGLRAFLLRNDAEPKKAVEVAGRAYSRGTLSLEDVAALLRLDPSDAIVVLERCGYCRSLDAIRLDEDARSRILALMEQDRRARGGRPAYDRAYVQRDVIASERIEGVDAREWVRGAAT